MPDKETKARARKDKREGKSPSTQAGEFVHEEIEHVREGKHGARSAKQAIAIGLSKARQAGVKVPPKKGASSKAKKKSSHSRSTAKAKKSSSSTKAKKSSSPSKTRSRATSKALRREGHSAASHKALSAQAKKAARKRSARSRSASAKKAARTRARRS